MKLFLIFLTLLGTACLPAQPEVAVLDSVLSVFAEKENFSGNFLIARDGKAVYRRSFGYANWDTKQAFSDTTSFRLASVSKQFTALGVAILESDGKLSYDDPLAQHIPEMAGYPGVTIRHLLHHYGGLPDYMGLAGRHGDKDEVYDNEMIISLMAEKQPKAEFTPGEKFSYSNSGYLMLASVIERVSGQSYGDFLAARVFGPLGMRHTAVNYPTTRTDGDAAAGFEPDRKTGQLVRVDNGGDPYGYGMLAGIVGDGAVFSSTDDLLRYHLGMQTDVLLPADKRQVLITAGAKERAPDRGYAFGQQVRMTSKSGLRISHSGSWAGALTWLERYPESGNLITILSNNNSDFTTLRLLARQFLTGGDITLPVEHTAAKIKGTNLQLYPGVYRLNDEMNLTITVKGKKLKMEPTGQPAYPMTPYAENGFFLEGTNISIEFPPAEQGKVTTLSFTQDGQTTACPRR